MAKEPFQQGDLDGLCGIYALVNAAKLVAGPISRDRAKSLVTACLDSLGERYALPSLVTVGLGVYQVLGLMRDVFQAQLPVTYHRPFAKAGPMSLDHYWQTVTEFLEERPRRAVILAFHNARYAHWTLAKAISQARMELFDSDGNSLVCRRHCTTGSISAQRPMGLSPSATIFVSRTGR